MTESFEEPALPGFGPPAAVAPAARASDPDTSHRAAAMTNRDTQRARIMVALSLWGPLDAPTLAERLEMHTGSVSKRCGELVAAGHLAVKTDEDGKPVTRLSPSGARARVLTVTEQGHEALDHLRRLTR